MPRHREEALVTNGRLVIVLTKAVLLHVAHALHDEANGEEHNACNVSPGSKVMLRILCDVGGIQNRHGQRHGPHPDHLEDPEAEEGEEVVALVVEAVIGSGAENAEEEEA